VRYFVACGGGGINKTRDQEHLTENVVMFGPVQLVDLPPLINNACIQLDRFSGRRDLFVIGGKVVDLED
jgi:hypothetical protein